MAIPERIELDDGHVVRRSRVDDAEALASCVRVNLDHLQPWMPWAQPASTDARAQAERLAGLEVEWDEGTTHDFLITTTAGDLIGAIGLLTRQGPGSYEIGYWVDAAHQGRGVVTRAARALTEIALAQPGITRVEIHCDAANAASTAVPRRLGYTLTSETPRPPQAPSEAGVELTFTRTPSPFAMTPSPPYTAVIFTSVRIEEDGDGYDAMADAMDVLAREQPGYLGVESARDATSGITVSYWTSVEHARAWKRVADHAGAQRLGRERWYAAYRVRVATVEREYGHG